MYVGIFVQVVCCHHSDPLFQRSQVTQQIVLLWPAENLKLVVSGLVQRSTFEAKRLVVANIDYWSITILQSQTFLVLLRPGWKTTTYGFLDGTCRIIKGLLLHCTDKQFNHKVCTFPEGSLLGVFTQWLQILGGDTKVVVRAHLVLLEWIQTGFPCRFSPLPSSYLEIHFLILTNTFVPFGQIH